jgi:hypothetical protein
MQGNPQPRLYRMSQMECVARADDPCMRFFSMLACATLSAALSAAQSDSSSRAGQPLPDAIEAMCDRSPEQCGDEFLTHDYGWHEFQRHPNPGFFAWGADLQGDAWPLRTNSEVFHNRIFVISHAVWLGSIVYDVELTHQGLAHHNCIEANLNAGEHPGRTALYVGSIPTTALGLAWDFFWTKYLFEPNGVAGPIVGSIYHIRGGTRWLTECWQ